MCVCCEPIYVQIRRMDMEARSLAPDDKQPLLLKLRTYKSELSGMKKAAKEAASAGGGAHTRMTHTRAHAEKMLVSLLLFCSALSSYGWL